VNDAPVLFDSVYTIGIGQQLNRTLGANDPDSPSLTFSITANGGLGTAAITDSAAGTFSYVSGTAGVDSFFFQAYDGALFAASPGKIRITVMNLPPQAQNDSGVTIERGTLADTFHATDPDLPPQPITYAIVAAGHLGTAVMMDSAAGAFVYTPAPNTFGIDTVGFVASDGLATSAPAMFRVIIRPAVDAGDILVGDTRTIGVVLIDPATGAQGIVSSGGSFSRPLDVVVEPSGQLMVLDGTNGLIRVDPVTGNQTPLTPGSAFTTAPLGPTSLAIEQDGSFLVADGLAGVKRVDPVSGNVSVVATGTNLNLVVGVAVDAAGTIFVGDASALAGGASAIVRVNPSTGAQSVVATGGNIKLPIGITLDANGTIFLCQPNSFVGAPPDLLEKVDTATGVETVITPTDTLRIPLNIEIDAGGKLIVSNTQGDKIMSIDSASGATTTVSAGGYIQEPFGLTIVRPRAGFAADRSDIDFGTVTVGASGEDSMTVSNTGSAPLYITSVTADSAQFTVIPGSATVPPSGSATFYVTFSPTAADTIAGNITFVHSAFGSPAIVTVHGRGGSTGVEGSGGGVPKSYNLYANYPNPFNPTTTVRFDIARQSVVTLKIYSLIGTEVATIIPGRQYAAGSYTARLDASVLASGVYFYELHAEASDGSAGFRSVRKMLLVR
jgi:streptogramin lyase